VGRFRAGVRLMPTLEAADGSLHEVHVILCGRCWCDIQRATDDHELAWEPGQNYDDRCKDRHCVCHFSPIRGVRHSRYTHAWKDHRITAGERVREMLDAFLRSFGD